MNAGWKGNATRSSLKYGEGCLKLTGTGEYNNPGNTYPMFWMNDKVRQRYSEAEPLFNQFVCTVDIKADGSCGGIMAFNAVGSMAAGATRMTEPATSRASRTTSSTFPPQKELTVAATTA